MALILNFSRVRSWRRDDPKAEQIRIGDGSVRSKNARGNVTIAQMIHVPFAPTPAVRDEPFIPATCSGPNLAPKWWYYHCWEDDSDVAFSSYESRAWKARAHKPRKQWQRHVRRIPTLDLSVRFDDQADIAAK